ncbi:MAG: leucine-rich repeat protein [Bacteroides sp.]|nr:leucine-rich repeat protein [Bacillota bacterium]MCM1393468.1 leucine-rich repeat protein [[Eubacterium] siraeum]MCM1455298.1 leucine-rich repeat protein [Bacteroides sp.]
MRKTQKILPIILIIALCITTVLTLTACNKSYTKAKTDDMIAKLQSSIDLNKSELDKKVKDLTEKHNTQFEELVQAIHENEQSLYSLKNLYNAKITAFEKADADNKKAIEDLKAEYDAKFAALQSGGGSGSSGDNSAAITNLKAEYDAKIAELEEAIADNQKSIEDLTTEYNAEAEALEAEIAQANQTIAANKTALENSISNLTSAYEAKVANLEDLIETIQNVDATQDGKIADLEEKVAALLAVKSYTVTFDSNGGSPVPSQTVDKFEKITRPDNPIRTGEGLLFDGWYIEDEKWSFFGNIVTENITLTAKWIWSGITYTLSDDGASYSVTGYRGTFNEIAVESTYKGLPVTTIENDVFKDCLDLTSVTLPESLTKIGSSTFSGCTELKKINIPNNVTSIGSSAFSGCVGLTEINIPDKIKTIASSVFSGCNGLRGELTIPVGITSIGASAFQGCDGITEITIPDGMKTIGASAFQGCAGLTEISVPASVTSIGEGAFRGCSRLENITLPFIGQNRNTTTEQHDSKSISQYAFGFIFGGGTKTFDQDATPTNQSGWIYQGASKSIISSSGDIKAAYYGYYIPASLRSVTITDVTEISAYAFYGCTMLTSVTIPKGISIGTAAFTNCVSPTRVDFSAQ